MISTSSVGKCKFNKVNKLHYIYLIVPMTSPVHNTLSFLRRLKTCIRNFSFFEGNYIPDIYQSIYMDTYMYWLQFSKIKFVLMPLYVCVCVFIRMCTHVSYNMQIKRYTQWAFVCTLSFRDSVIPRGLNQRDFFLVVYFLCKFLNLSLYWGRDLVTITVHLYAELF